MTDSPPDRDQPEGESLAVIERKPKTARPPLYKVILLNDDYTPMDFVVLILRHIFRKGEEDAIRVMLEIHVQGAGLCGVYTRDVAETKAEEVLQLAHDHAHPLQCVVERE
jgi:ATP-dependent Clp protease adaptor protein ClpS